MKTITCLEGLTFLSSYASAVGLPTSATNSVAAMIDLAEIGNTAPPPSDIDVSKTYVLSEYNFLGNREWSISYQDGKGVWLHDSRLYTLINATESATLGRRSTSQWWRFGATGGDSYCPGIGADSLAHDRCYS
ncbi:hypothetical protein CNMCM8927_003589 [Aspergillus lentulus]|uniref:Uncharacterized protein n=1 Tax=Aspergillus lentulus TaxID=293939 RepID=A0AAN6BR34_ASPLE|nr:hypothetical protein CNMCM8927_003589 [Aspergillus lentulus]